MSPAFVSNSKRSKYHSLICPRLAHFPSRDSPSCVVITQIDSALLCRSLMLLIPRYSRAFSLYFLHVDSIFQLYIFITRLSLPLIFIHSYRFSATANEGNYNERKETRLSMPQRPDCSLYCDLFLVPQSSIILPNGQLNIISEANFWQCSRHRRDPGAYQIDRDKILASSSAARSHTAHVIPGTFFKLISCGCTNILWMYKYLLF